MRTLDTLLDRAVGGEENAAWELSRSVFAPSRESVSAPSGGWPEPEQATSPLVALTRALVSNGALDMAAGMARRLTGLYSSWLHPPSLLDRELGCLAAVFVESDHLEQALEILDGVAVPGRRSILLRYLVEAAGIDRARPIVGPQLDDLEKAVVAADPRVAMPNRANLVLLSAAMGEIERVGRLVDGLSPLELDPQQVCAVLATARARTGPPRRGGHDRGGHLRRRPTVRRVPGSRGGAGADG
ncbi:hypothetical protein D7D52_07720 [Nocardia yunnanensis]|uniref:Uncharacterized protein n=1 Tax=Nocardia yunnanensis TaxID=2382165 RepID=A0A386Z840_9NOCA|nr:hypothetical protein [Nocardia yunnanensis]AYF73766.1 hypothetical protein D7D52_07720 [Nocardia yunnanensis]